MRAGQTLRRRQAKHGPVAKVRAFVRAKNLVELHTRLGPTFTGLRAAIAHSLGSYVWADRLRRSGLNLELGCWLGFRHEGRELDLRE